jgi:hypothetical protein
MHLGCQLCFSKTDHCCLWTEAITQAELMTRGFLGHSQMQQALAQA